MTLRFADSFAHYSLGQIGRKWTNAQTGYGGCSLGTGRFGAGSKAFVQGDGRNSQTTTLSVAPASLIMGFAYQMYGFGAKTVAGISDNGTQQCTLLVEPDNTLAVYRGNGAVRIGKGTVPLKFGVWNYIEWSLTIDPAAGASVVRVNGSVVLTIAGANTRNTGSSSANQVYIQGTNGDQYSDVYVLDTAGAVNNAFLGDVRVQAIYPTGAGTYTEFSTLVGAATQWQATADNPADDDTSYIGDATAGHRSSFATGDVTPTSGTVPAIVINHTSRKDDAGARTVAGLARSGGVDAATAGSSVGVGFQIYQEIMELDPSAAAWTIGSVNGAEFGVKEIA